MASPIPTTPLPTIVTLAIDFALPSVYQEGSPPKPTSSHTMRPSPTHRTAANTDHQEGDLLDRRYDRRSVQPDRVRLEVAPIKEMFTARTAIPGAALGPKSCQNTSRMASTTSRVQ